MLTKGVFVNIAELTYRKAHEPGREGVLVLAWACVRACVYVCVS